MIYTVIKGGSVVGKQIRGHFNILTLLCRGHFFLQAVLAGDCFGW